MKNKGKRRFASEKEIERFCQGTAEVLTRIHDRINEEESKKQQKKKTATLAASG